MARMINIENNILCYKLCHILCYVY